LPTPIAQKVNRDVNTLLAMPDVQERLEQAKWAKVVKEGNVKVES